MAPNSINKSVDIIPRNRKSSINKSEKEIKSELPGDIATSPIKSKKSKPLKTKLPNRSMLISIIFLATGACFYLSSLQMLIFKEPTCNSSDQEEFGYLAKSDEHFKDINLHQVKCHRPGYRNERRLGAEPQRCGTLVYDELVPFKNAVELRKLAAKLVYEMGETNYYSRESINLHWVNLHNVFRDGYKLGVFNDEEFDLIKNTSEAAKKTISRTFGIPESGLHFTTVAQFTRYRPMTRYSQFRHVDKVRSRPLVVTSILWLSTYGSDFGGGRTAFLTGGPKPFTPLLVEPKLGRFAAWTSGWENPHEVMQMLYGERLALIFAFTANQFLGEKDMESLKKWSLSTKNNPFLN